MEWVAVAVTIARDPAVHRLAAALRVRVPEVVGLLTLTFAEMTQHAPAGRIADVPDTLLESWACWHGKRGAFGAQFRAELCDDAGLVTAWEKYNGANIRRATAARERTRAWRERKEAPPNPRNGTHTGTHTVRASVCGTVQDSTVQDSTVQDKTGQKASSSSSADVARLLAGLPNDTVRLSWESEIGVARDGMHGAPLTDEQINRACRDYAGNGHLASPSLRHFRAFLADAGRPPTPPRTPTANGDNPYLTPEMRQWAADQDAKEQANV